MSNVIDLTRKEDGNLRSITLSNNTKTLIIPSAKSEKTITKSNSSFLKEVDLDRAKGVCFEKHIPIKSKTPINYDWAWMKLPQSIQYVDYVLGSNDSKTTINTANKSAPLSKSVLSPLLLLQDSETPRYDDDHVCGNKKQPDVILESHHAGSSEGCSRSIQCLIDGESQRYFELFYWDKENGPLRHSIDYKKAEDNTPAETKIKVSDQSFYLIPLVMSEKNIVFYAIEDSDKAMDNIISFYEIISGKMGDGSMKPPRPLIDMSNPLIMNDKMGILVTTALDFCEESN